jgi:ribosome-associated protein
MDSAQKAKILMDAVEDRQGGDPVLIDLRDKGVMIADYFLVTTCNSAPHLRAVWENVQEVAEENRFNRPGLQGEASIEWRLLDFGDIVVHLMTDEARERYKLEEYWSNPQPKGALPPLHPGEIEYGAMNKEISTDEDEDGEWDEDNLDDLDEDDLDEEAFFEKIDTEVEPIDEGDEDDDEVPAL